MNFQEAVRLIESFPNLEQPIPNTEQSEVMTPERMSALLLAMGNPHLNRGCVHVTGTKGKGSTSAMIASILDAADGSAGLFVSPHIQSYVERFSFGGKLISEAELAEAMQELEGLFALEHEREPIAFFHALIALFFHLAERATRRGTRVRWQVIEVGLGGDFDPTNVFATKDLAVFTPVHIEHKRFLGRTPEAIASRKAGIMTPGCDVVIAPQPYEEAERVLVDRAREMGCRTWLVEQSVRPVQVSTKAGRNEVLIDSEHGRIAYSTGMIGPHQVINSMTALTCAFALRERGTNISDSSIQGGLSRAWLPGRIDVLSREPLVVADGAHTPEAATYLCQTMKESFDFKSVVTILCLNSDKNVQGIFDALAQFSKVIIAARTKCANSLAPEALMRSISSPKGKDIILRASVEEALDFACDLASKDDLVLVTGSMYAAGEARTYLSIKPPSTLRFHGNSDDCQNDRTCEKDPANLLRNF